MYPTFLRQPSSWQALGLFYVPILSHVYYYQLYRTDYKNANYVIKYYRENLAIDIMYTHNTGYITQNSKNQKGDNVIREMII